VIASLLPFTARAIPGPSQEEPPTEQGHEMEELGVNRFTAPKIEQVFDQLDRLRPLPFAQLWRNPPASTPNRREQKGLIFGGLIADGFLIVSAQKANLVDELGRVLIREARGLGVADRVIRHSASLTELGRAAKWDKVRSELIQTQADVERALIDLRDEKMAALISLGGWLRGLEIGAAAVEAEFTPERARILAQPELVDYFVEELDTLPPALAHLPLFDKLRDELKQIRTTLTNAQTAGLTLEQVRDIHNRATALNLMIGKNE
jgi:hypothetical protein